MYLKLMSINHKEERSTNHNKTPSSLSLQYKTLNRCYIKDINTFIIKNRNNQQERKQKYCYHVVSFANQLKQHQKKQHSKKFPIFMRRKFFTMKTPPFSK